MSKPAFGFHNRLVKWSEDFVVKGDYGDELKDAINNLNAKIATFKTNRTGSGFIDYTYSLQEVKELIELMGEVSESRG